MSDGNPNPLLSVPTQVTVTDVTETEIDPRKKEQLKTLGQLDSGWWNHLWAAFWSAVLTGTGYIATSIIDVWDFFMILAANFFFKAQGEQNPNFWILSGKILGDLTGVEVNTDDLKQSAFGSGRLVGIEKFGQDLYDKLAEEFKPTSGNLEDSDSGPAVRFLGFLLNWSIRQGNVEAMTQFLPQVVRFAEGFRTYGELMGKNLGLGRMARRALQPLIQTLVADPLQFQLNEQWRPKRLAKEQAIKQYFRNPDFLTQLRKELAQEGYSQDRQDFMIADSRPLISDRDIVRLHFLGQLEDPDFTKELSARGYDPNGQDLILRSSRPTLDREEILELYEFGQIGRDDALGWLAKLGYDPPTAELVVIGFEMKIQAVPRPKPIRHKARTFSQLRKEFLDGVIDLIELQTALTQAGYGDDDVSAMIQDVLVDQAHRKTTGAAHAIPRLSWAQLKEAYKAGILDLTAVEAHLKARGYTQDDLNALLKELPAPPPPPTPSTP